MIRELFHIGPLAVSPFGVLMMLAFLAAYVQLRRGLRQVGAGDEEDASALLLAGGLGGVAGAKIYYALLYRDWALLLDRSGLVWYGGFALGGVLVLWTLRRRRLPPWPTADAAALSLALGYAVGRIGCFVVGDDYGVPTGLPWGVRFPVGLPPSTAGNLRALFGVRVPPGARSGDLLAVHPTQLYETGLCLLIWWVARRRFRRSGGDGSTALLVVTLLALERFAIEFLRAKDDRFLGPFTLAQAASVLVLGIVVVVALQRRHRRPRASGDV